MLIAVVIAGLSSLSPGYNYGSGTVSGTEITGAQVSSFGNCMITGGKVVCTLDQREYSSVRACISRCAGSPSEEPEPVDPVETDPCIVNGIELVAGVRTENRFCGTNGRLNPQKTAGATCRDDYECSSNVCRLGKCISRPDLLTQFCGSGHVSGGCTCCNSYNTQCNGPWGPETCETKTLSCSNEAGECKVTGDCCPGESLNCVDFQCVRCAAERDTCGDDLPCCSDSDLECIDSVCVQKSSCPSQGEECSETLKCCPDQNLECQSVQGRQKCVACPSEGERCSSFNPCCSDSDLECIDSVCQLKSSCADEWEDCSASVPCCPGYGIECLGGICQYPEFY